MVVCHTGAIRPVKCVRIEGGMGLCFLELRYIAGILPVIKELEELSEMISHGRILTGLVCSGSTYNQPDDLVVIIASWVWVERLKPPIPVPA